MSKSNSNQAAGNFQLIAQNKKAKFSYHILETYEAGIVLTGYEIKSIRNKGANIKEAYVVAKSGELWLQGAHITPYSYTKDREINPVRSRKLLLKKIEINKLQGKVNERGFTIVPLELYVKNGWAKVKIALAKGKSAPDKRHSIKERDAKREMERALKSK
ncbi:MAG: SsrA-binding protein SmpB [Deltaproteobacteria bacterium]|nr:SsrA-binding protein SmpB [Deltaproteobacteria bacterium]